MADLEYEIQEASARQAIMRTDIGDLQRAAWEAAAAKAREKSAADKIRYEATVSALRQQESELVTQLEAEQQARSKAITEHAQQQRCLQTQVDNANVELAEDALELHKSQCEVAQLRRALQAAHGSWRRRSRAAPRGVGGAAFREGQVRDRVDRVRERARQVAGGSAGGLARSATVRRGGCSDSEPAG